MKSLFAAIAAMWLCLSTNYAPAQTSYPEQSIRILVDFPPGGPPDIAARLLADKFGEA